MSVSSITRGPRSGKVQGPAPINDWRERPSMPLATAPPVVALRHLDSLWFQVTGTLCNLACTHCFNSSGPNVRTFTFLTPVHVRRELAFAVDAGVREIFFTGGEPFLHPGLPDMVREALTHAPVTILTNGVLINDRIADRLAGIERESRYSLELRISLDHHQAAANDAIRGAGTYDAVMRAIARLCRRGLLPLVTVVRTWSDPAADSGHTGAEGGARGVESMEYERNVEALRGFVRILHQAGYANPRIKILPALPLGRERRRSPGTSQPKLTADMLDGFDTDLLMCSSSRIVTSRGVWVCPLLVAMPDARVGDSLAVADAAYPLRHSACHSCYRYGTICGNVNVQIEGPAATNTAAEAEGPV